MTVTIDSVTTHDAAPTVVPHRVSARAGKESAVIAFTPSSGARSWESRIISGTDVNSGTRLLRGGNPIVGRFKCGARNPVGSNSRGPFGALSTTVFYTAFGPPDGAGDVYLWDHPIDGAWS